MVCKIHTTADCIPIESNQSNFRICRMLLKNKLATNGENIIYLQPLAISFYELVMSCSTV